MNYLSIENISKTFGDKILFDKISFGIAKGEKVAILAKNGAGKTTLLKAIAGLETPDEGRIVLRKEIITSILSQEQQFTSEKNIFQFLFGEESDSLNAIKAYEEALLDSHDADKLQAAMDLMDQYKAWDYEAKVKEVLGKLGLDQVKQPVNVLSGGQKKRLALAKVLLEEPDFLILDEPTNHLDLEMIEWLENFLEKSNVTMLLVTHDRYFLERVCDTIIELEEGKLYQYKGNYSYYLNKKAEREEIEQVNISKAKSLMRKELEWIRKQPKARGTKAKYRVDAFEVTKEKAGKKITKDELILGVKTTRLGSKIIELHKLSKSFGDLTVMNKFSYQFQRHEKIGIVGKNGVGKTTFLNMLMGLELPDSGKIAQGETVKFGYFTQNRIAFDPDKRVIEVIKDIAEIIPIDGGRTVSASEFLERFLFPRSMQYNPVNKLSGGEKGRLQLLTVLVSNPNFLILDEPTNDLDIYTLNVLEDYLENFGGCLIIVSHDRYFIDKISDHIFAFEGDGIVKDYPGNYTQYREKLEAAEELAKLEIKKPPPIVKVTDPNEKKKATYAEKLEYQKLEKEIEKLEKDKHFKTSLLEKGIEDHKELVKISEDLRMIIEDIDEKSLRWLELSELV